MKHSMIEGSPVISIWKGRTSKEDAEKLLENRTLLTDTFGYYYRELVRDGDLWKETGRLCDEIKYEASEPEKACFHAVCTCLFGKPLSREDQDKSVYHVSRSFSRLLPETSQDTGDIIGTPEDSFAGPFYRTVSEGWADEEDDCEWHTDEIIEAAHIWLLAPFLDGSGTDHYTGAENLVKAYLVASEEERAFLDHIMVRLGGWTLRSLLENGHQHTHD